MDGCCGQRHENGRIGQEDEMVGLERKMVNDGR